MTGIKRLSSRQSRKVNTLVKKECCNCENGNCILLDDGDTCVCPQLISYSLLCKWFRIAVLPLDKLLYAELYQTEDRSRNIRKARPSVRAQLTADKKTAAPKKAAAKRKNHDLEV